MESVENILQRDKVIFDALFSGDYCQTYSSHSTQMDSLEVFINLNKIQHRDVVSDSDIRKALLKSLIKELLLEIYIIFCDEKSEISQKERENLQSIFRDRKNYLQSQLGEVFYKDITELYVD